MNRPFILKRDQIAVLVPHNPGDIQKYYRRVIRLNHGHVIADGRTEEVLKEN